MKEAPYPKKIPKKLYAHNDERIDNYYWLRDDKRKDKNVISYLVKENNFTNSWFKSNNVNSSKIFNYYKNAIPDFEESFKSQIDEYLYFSTSSLSQEYRKYYQILKKKKKLILDVNKLGVLCREKGFLVYWYVHYNLRNSGNTIVLPRLIVQ